MLVQANDVGSLLALVPAEKAHFGFARVEAGSARAHRIGPLPDGNRQQPTLAAQAPSRRRRWAARAEGVSPFPDQYRIELIERA
jgi:hypothetical protein